MRRGLKNKADTLTELKNGKLIKDFRSNSLSDVDSSYSSKLWKIANSTRGRVLVLKVITQSWLIICLLILMY